MRTRILALLLSAALSGCTCNYYHEQQTKPDKTVVDTTFLRGSIGTNGSVETLELKRGDDSLTLNGQKRDETKGLGVAASGVINSIAK